MIAHDAHRTPLRLLIWVGATFVIGLDTRAASGPRQGGWLLLCRQPAGEDPRAKR
jgi:hypothetical protein